MRNNQAKRTVVAFVGRTIEQIKKDSDPSFSVLWSAFTQAGGLDLEVEYPDQEEKDIIKTEQGMRNALVHLGDNVSFLVVMGRQIYSPMNKEAQAFSQYLDKNVKGENIRTFHLLENQGFSANAEFLKALGDITSQLQQDIAVQTKKLALLFIGVNTAQWVFGDSALPLSQEISKIRAAGRLFIIGDKESTDVTDALEFQKLRQCVSATGRDTVNWIIVRQGSGRPWTGPNVVADTTTFITNNLNMFTYRQFFDMPNQTSTAKAQALYECIVKHNQQPQQEITMKQQDERLSPATTRDLTDFTKPEAMDILTGALRFISGETNAPFDKEKLIVDLKLYHEQLAREVAADRQKPIRNKQRELTDIALSIATIATHFEHRRESLSDNDNRMVESLRKIETRTSALALKGAEDMSFNGETLLQRLAGEFAKGHQQLEQSIVKLAKDFAAANKTLEQAIDGQAVGAYERHQQLIHNVNNIERSLSVKVEDNLQYLLGVLLRQRASSQPFGPLNPIPVNSFPQMPDGFGFPGPSYNPDYPRGTIDPLARVRGMNECAIPPVNPPHHSGYGKWGASKPEEFAGVFVLHAEMDVFRQDIERVRAAFQAAYPQSQFHFMHYEKADVDETLRTMVKETLDSVEKHLPGADAFHIVIEPILASSPMDKVKAIQRMLTDNGVSFVRMVYGRWMANAPMVQAQLNPLIWQHILKPRRQY